MGGRRMNDNGCSGKGKQVDKKESGEDMDIDEEEQRNRDSSESDLTNNLKSFFKDELWSDLMGDGSVDDDGDDDDEDDDDENNSIPSSPGDNWLVDERDTIKTQ